MSIKVTCVQCGTTHQVNQRLAGKRVRCPQCDTAVHVPEIEQPDEATLGSDGDEDAEIVEVEAEPLPADDVADVDTVPEFSHEQPSAFAHRPLTEQAAPAAMSTTTLNVPDTDEEFDQVLPRSKRAEEEMDMTPMVDVTFLLLIFFMVTAAFSLQKSIEMPRQQTDQPSTNVQDEPQDELDMVEVQVDELGGFLVMAPDWERETPGKQNLILALKEAIAGRDAGMRLVVKVHEMAKLRSLVDAMDAGTIANYSQIEVTQVESFD